MKVELQGISKRYQFEWVVRNLSYSLQASEQYAITGPNGSGKSTLLKLISGHLSPSKGTVSYSLNDRPLEIYNLYRHLAYAAPYIELIEELTLLEAVRFHCKFKRLLPGLDQEKLLDRLALKKARNKQIRYFSSGMKQRLKLGLAICSDASLLLLDEPTTNLDQQGIDWYRELIEDFTAGRLVVIASNAKVDFDFCNHQIDIQNYKRKVQS